MLALGAGGLAAVPASAAGTCPSGQSYLDAHVGGTTTADTHVCVSDVANWHDLVDPPFQIRTNPGRDPQNEPNTHEALSVRELASQVAGLVGGFSVDSLTYVEIVDRSGTRVSRLTAADLRQAGSNGFENSLMPAVFFQPGYGMFYIRPLRPDPQDVNYNDYLAGAENGALGVYLHTSGSPLSPTISVDSASVTLGTSSSFTLALNPPEAGQLTYSWSFGDGTSSAEANPTHQWSASGVYRVKVAVARPGQPPAQSNIVTVTVNPKEPTPTPTPTSAPTNGTPGGTGGEHNPVTGPDKSGGNQAGGTAGNKSGAPGPRASTPTAKPKPAPNREKVTVSGVLVGSPQTQAERGKSANAAARQYAKPASWRLPVWLWSASAIVALLGLGALSESGRFRRLIERKRP